MQEHKVVQPLSKTYGGFLKKRNMQLPCDPAIALLGIYPENTTRTPVHSVHSSCTHHIPKRESAQMCCTGRWWDKPWHIHATGPHRQCGGTGCRQPHQVNLRLREQDQSKRLLTTRCQVYDTLENRCVVARGQEEGRWPWSWC